MNVLYFWRIIILKKKEADLSLEIYIFLIQTHLD